MIQRTAAGLLLADAAADLSAWSASAFWATAADPALVAFDPSTVPALTPGGIGAADHTGVRQGQLFVEGGVWTLLYDGGDGSTGWVQQYATSADLGRTWAKHGAIGPGLADPIHDPSLAATSTGWIEKRGGTYYLYRVGTDTLFGPPNDGLSAPPYGGDIWTASSIVGTWTWLRALTLTAGAWTQNEHLPGSVYYDGSTYHAFDEGRGPSGGYVVGRSTASAAGGPWTTITPEVLGVLADGRLPENPKVFYHAGLARYCLLVNLIAPAGTYTDQNAALLSTSLTDWSGATIRRIQHVSPLDSPNAVGVIIQVTGPDGALIAEADGSLPALFDGQATGFSPGWHIGRTIRYAVLEPSAACARFVHPGDATPRRISRAAPHTALVADFAAELRSIDATSGLLAFEFRRQDDANHYRLVLTPAAGLRLDKVVAGSVTTLQAASSPTETGGVNLVHRVRLIASGTGIDAYLNGEHQIAASNATYAAGVGVAFLGAACDADVRLLSLHSGQTVRVTPTRPGDVVTLRGAGGVPMATATATGTTTQVAALHGPLVSVQVNNGPLLTPNGGIWGGDAYRLDAVPTSSFFG